MRKTAILASILALGACNSHAEDAEATASAGGGETREYQVASFDRVSLGGSHNVIVTVGGAPSVRAEGDPKVLERLEVKVEDGELHIGSRNKTSFGFSKKRGHATVHVTVPSLSAASIGGSGDMRIDKVAGERFAASIGGSGDMEVGNIAAKTAAFSIAGSGNIRASGTAEEAAMSVAGSGDMGLEGLQVRRARVSVVGSGDVRAHASETADVSIMGSGDVRLTGGARCSVDKMGSGSVDCGA